MPRFIRLLIAAAVGAVVLAAPSPAVAASPSIRTNPTAPFASESFSIRGTVPTSFPRTARLQRYLDGRWTHVKSTRTTSRGSYAFTYTTSSASASFRTYVPAVRHKGRTYASQKSATKRIRPIRRTVALQMTTAPDLRPVAAITFFPAASGRTVTVSHLEGTTRVVDAVTALPATGRLTLPLPRPVAGTYAYRAQVTRSGMATLTSPTVPFVVAELVSRIDIVTADRQPITSDKEYVAATIAIDPRDSGLLGPPAPVPAELRIRGNSTSRVEAKLPYKIKLGAKTEMLGMPASKDWVLLANYFDRSMLRNDVAFEISRAFQLPWTPRLYFTEVWLNGSYRGLYQFGQGIEAQDGRVQLAEGGQLLEADSWVDTDPWFRTDKGLQVFFKDPDDPTTERLVEVEAQVQAAEDSIYADDFADPTTGYAAHLDIDSFVDWYLVNEIMKNNDSAMNNSIWMVLAPDGRLSMGPVWDFDQAAGNRSVFELDQPTGWFVGRNWYLPDLPMYTPSQIRGEPGHWFNRLLTDPAFVAKVEARWSSVSLAGLPAYVDTMGRVTAGAAARNFADGNGGAGLPVDETGNPFYTSHVFQGSWPGEVTHLRDWLTQRVAWMDAQLG